MTPMSDLQGDYHARSLQQEWTEDDDILETLAQADS